jgi:hypothetical protein
VIRTSAALAAALAILTFAAAGCGGDEESTAPTTTAAGTTGASGASGASGADGQKADIDAIATELEDAGFEVTEQKGGDLEVIGSDGLSAEAGLSVARPGAGDVSVQVFATEDDAKTAKEANSQGFTTAEAEGTIVITGTEANDALQNEVASVVFG